MKTIFLSIILALLVSTSYGQTPEKFNYQMSIHDAQNNVIGNQVIGMQISIIQTSENGTAVYVETQTPTTNTNGIASIEVGSGTLVSGSFNGIDWSAGPYFLKTETDVTGGNSYTLTGTSELLSVPFALHAKTSINSNAVGGTVDQIAMFTSATTIGDSPISRLNENIGIGTTTPSSLFQVNQTAAVDGVLTTHSGEGGNALEIETTNTTNASSAFWVQNNTIGSSVNSQTLLATSNAIGVQATNLGLGPGMLVNQMNTGDGGQGIYIDQDGTGTFSRGMDIDLDAANTSEGLTVFHSGTGIGGYFGLANSANNITGVLINQDGTGAFSRGLEIDMDASNISQGLAVFHSGAGIGGYFGLTNSASNVPGVLINQDGTGVLSRGLEIAMDTANVSQGLGVFHSGVGIGAYFGLTNVANNRPAIFINHDGTGEFSRGYEIQMDESNVSEGFAVFHSGIGDGAYVELENESNSESGVIVFHKGTGIGITSIAFPETGNNQIAIYGESVDATAPGEGVGVRGIGNFLGVHGSSNGGSQPTSYAVFASGDMSGSGAKAFTIDHPLDPQNKLLRHYSIESNEVLNMYRGIAMLDSDGKATIELPAYFEATNINPSYQLTAIGTAIVPYVSKEITNNMFVVEGDPNTKVSWTVHAQRNDPTLRYFNDNGKNYMQEEISKPVSMKGKYYTPEAYGKDKSEGVYFVATPREERLPSQTKPMENSTSVSKINKTPKKEMRLGTAIEEETIRK